MHVHILPFVIVALVLVVAPGPDTVLVTKNALLHGRRAALATVAGISIGLVTWVAAAALGLAALLRESQTAFTALRIAGAVYLAWLGLGALRAAWRRQGEPAGVASPQAGIGVRRGFRQGLLCNLGNPKIAVFFTSLLPQFVSGHRPGALPFLLLGGVFALLGLGWLSAYALLASRFSALLHNRRIKSALDAITGLVLIGVGVRLAVDG